MAEDEEVIRTLATLAEELANVQLRAPQPGFATVTAMPDLTSFITAFSDLVSTPGTMMESAGDWVTYVNVVPDQAR